MAVTVLREITLAEFPAGRGRLRSASALSSSKRIGTRFERTAVLHRRSRREVADFEGLLAASGVAAEAP